MNELHAFFFIGTSKLWPSLVALAQFQPQLLLNRPFHGFRCHLGWGSVAAKITVNVWEIVQLSNLVTPLLYNGV